MAAGKDAGSGATTQPFPIGISKAGRERSARWLSSRFVPIRWRSSSRSRGEPVGKSFLSFVTPATIAGLMLLAVASITAQTTAPRAASPDEELVAGCPRTSSEFYRCAKPKAAAFTPPRTPDGKPDMQGSWNASTTTGSQNIEEHSGDGFFFRATKSLIVDPPD